MVFTFHFTTEIENWQWSTVKIYDILTYYYNDYTFSAAFNQVLLIHWFTVDTNYQLQNISYTITQNIN